MEASNSKQWRTAVQLFDTYILHSKESIILTVINGAQPVKQKFYSPEISLQVNMYLSTLL
jgi:hypothetical protein